MIKGMWSVLVRAKANFTCQKCGSREFIQAHDPTGRHIDVNDGVCLCASCHADCHPDTPRKLFFKQQNHAYWSNVSASKLAKEWGYHPRTVIRAIKRLNIPLFGYLTDEDRARLQTYVNSSWPYKRVMESMGGQQ